MIERAIHWLAFIPLALLLALAALFCEITGVWRGFPFRPEWLWCLALVAALRTPPFTALLLFASSGLARDIVLGPKLGSATLAFVFVGWMTLYWQPFAADRGVFFQALFAGAAALPVALLRHSLDAGILFSKVWMSIGVASLVDAALTVLAYFPAVMFLSIPWFRPWRERSGFYY